METYESIQQSAATPGIEPTSVVAAKMKAEVRPTEGEVSWVSITVRCQSTVQQA